MVALAVVVLAKQQLLVEAAIPPLSVPHREITVALAQQIQQPPMLLAEVVVLVLLAETAPLVALPVAAVTALYRQFLALPLLTLAVAVVVIIKLMLALAALVAAGLVVKMLSER